MIYQYWKRTCLLYAQRSSLNIHTKNVHTCATGACFGHEQSYTTVTCHGLGFVVKVIIQSVWCCEW